MKLSDAIRLGAMLHAQLFGGSYMRDKDGNLLATCALAGAIEAGFVPRQIDNRVSRSLHCPLGCVHIMPSIPTIVVHLNDQHRWTRDQIADWVATVELADDPAAPATTADAVARAADLVTV